MEHTNELLRSLCVPHSARRTTSSCCCSTCCSMCCWARFSASIFKSFEYTSNDQIMQGQHQETPRVNDLNWVHASIPRGSFEVRDDVHCDVTVYARRPLIAHTHVSRPFRSRLLFPPLSSCSATSCPIHCPLPLSLSSVYPKGGCSVEATNALSTSSTSLSISCCTVRRSCGSAACAWTMVVRLRVKFTL